MESYKSVWGWNKKREWTQDFTWAKDANALSLYQSHPSETIFGIPLGELTDPSTGLSVSDHYNSARYQPVLVLC